LASLRLVGTTLLWWESKLQNGTQQVGNVFPSWKSFIIALRKKFYPLAAITEISSANGYRNPAASNSYEFTHGPKLPKKHF
jgi:hypothetical protein